MKKALLFIFLISAIDTSAQNIAAYIDYRNYFTIFDSGIKYPIEHNRVKSFKVGGKQVAYIDYLENFKVFYNGNANTLERVPIGNYLVSDYLIVYTLAIGSELYVVDKGKPTLLTTRASFYNLGDSIVTFYDQLSQSYKAYYKGKITELEYVSDDPPKDEKLSDNVAVFMSRTDELRVFYRGEITPLILITPPVTYQTGKNIVPYIDGYTSTFKAFYKGNTYEVETIQPLSFKTGDDMVAYETQDWTFSVFYDQRVTKLSSYQPKFYDVADSLVIFQEFNNFNVFYKGKIHTLESNFIPDKYYADYSTLVYFDQQNRLTVFFRGKKNIVTYEPVNEFNLYRNTLHYRVNNADYVYWMGKSF
ncbi:MAG: hypothetical protein AB7G44_06565 [Bacteroidia bacterium]